MKQGIFITFEGPDGSGKTTHAKLLAQWLEKQGFSVVLTREPGGTPFAESIRKLLLKPGENVFPATELLLYAASRAQHTQELIKPALAKGKFVLSDRYSDSTVAYQHFGRSLDINIINELNKIATGGLKPDLTVVIDIKTNRGMDRVSRNRAKDRLENENSLFHGRIRKGFLALSRKEPGRIKVITSGGSIQGTQEKILKITREFLKRKKLS
ncbi:MAG: dTMP kinase [Elusimicrobia bacterium RIFOXYB2_FULL_48_7]|nr:MAG: dTMP kinase [Elusimicrobia bacterium RIFOXYB2_FULL_48_7]